MILHMFKNSVAAAIKKAENTAVGIRHADHVAPLRKNLALTSLTSGGRSVGIVRLRTFFFKCSDLQ
jgi:hypothetical protein